VHIDAPSRVTARGDVDELRILMRNLIDNAVRYTPANGTVEVRVTVGGNGGAMLDIADSGPGIPLSERERAFDRFYRRDGSTGSGSGLGLAIVKAIASRHGATVTLGTSPLGGLRVTVAFPPPQASA
jgi:signal transduction histidine kinase